MTDTRLRIDKWLFHARLVKSRHMAAGLVLDGAVRIDGAVATKPAHPVAPGSVVAMDLRVRRRVVRVLALGERRGPAVEARALYEDLPVPREDELLDPPLESESWTAH